MLTFSDWAEMTGESININEANAVGRKGWVKVAAGALTVRANGQRNRVKSATSTNDKLDHLADLVMTTATLQTLNIATDLNDRTILKKGKR
ncbi:MAG: hypothetical protein QGF16_14635 [Rhodospirillales bacterium]|jgi:hypothetical protein|nr:hypothetical protein [Rhodospirillales bacterium]